MSTKINAEFAICGDTFCPNEITDALKINPTQQWIKGQKIRNKDMVRANTCWFYETGYEDSFDISDQLLKLIGIFNTCIEDLVEIRSKLKLDYRVLVAVNIENDDTPAMPITFPVIEFLSKIGGELDIDLYIN